MLSLSVDKKLDYSTPIFFVPAYVPLSPRLQSAGKTTADRPFNTPKKNNTIKANTSSKKSTPVVATKSIKTDVKPTTVAATVPKKTEPTKQEIVKQEVVKTEAPKQEPKIEEKKETKKIEPVKQEIVKKEPSFDKLRTSGGNVAQALDTTQEIVTVIPDNAQISHNYREVEALRKQAQLQKELVQTWKPPIGVSPDCACEISFFVNSTGKIEHIKMVKSSSVIMFDISARQALFAMKMPQWTYGKPFTINFK
jgi:hypothetical protein